MEDLFEKGIDYFNSGYFFEAHDTFEELWMDERDESKFFYQGLVQLSTGFYHFVMMNRKGALSQLQKGAEKLDAFRPEFNGIAVDVVMEKVREFITKLQETFPGESGYEDLIALIPKLQTKS